MPEQGVASDSYAIQYSESGKASRKDLPPEAMTLLFDILDVLAANPDAFPGRVRPISPRRKSAALLPPFTSAASDLQSRYGSPRPAPLALRGSEAAAHKACIY